MVREAVKANCETLQCEGFVIGAARLPNDARRGWA